MGPEVLETAGTEAVETAQRHWVHDDLSAHAAGQEMFERRRVFFSHFSGGLDGNTLNSLLIKSRGGLYPTDSGGLKKRNLYQHNSKVDNNN